MLTENESPQTEDPRDAEDRKTIWHLGFQGGIELELRPWREFLDFHQEKELSKEPLWLDLLITKLDPALRMDQHPIGRRMRRFTVFEYKSPEGALSINQFSKATGSALLFAGLGQHVNEIPLDELAVFLVRDSFPRGLFTELARLGVETREEAPGIFEVAFLRSVYVCLVVTSRLAENACPILSLLRKHVSTRQAGAFIREADSFSEPGDLENFRAVLNTIISANPEIVEWLRRNAAMLEPLRELVQPWLDESWKLGQDYGWKQGHDDGRKQKTREIVGRMLRCKLPVTTIMQYAGLSEAEVRQIANSIGVPLTVG